MYKKCKRIKKSREIDNLKVFTEDQDSYPGLFHVCTDPNVGGTSGASIEHKYSTYC